ncbi:TIM-barrel domain-containing protein [Nakamurella sp.]|uniref:glycoside hydrolase family 31 protein n=1 Tax=Nakamurella sp. TaxID=1869182 RepID=UPI003783740C
MSDHRLPDPLVVHPVADPGAVVRGEKYRITVLTDGLLRLEYADDGAFEDRASEFALHREQPVPPFVVRDAGHALEIVTDRLHLIYDRGPFTTSGLSVQVRGNISSYHSVWRYGEPVGDLGGTARTLDLADGRIPLEPGVASRLGFSVIDDSRSLLLDADGWVAPRPPGRTDLYLFAYGHDYPAAVQAFYAVSGHPPVLPRWALGNWWSRYHRYTAAEYRELIERFRAEGLPFSVSVIDMDWHLVDVDPAHGSGWTGYSWNRELFPDPAAFLEWLHANGLRVTLNVHPADGVRAFEDSYPAMAAALGRDAAAAEPIAFDVTDRDFLAAYFEVLHRELEREGVDFWWLDWQSGPHSRVIGIDPLWMLNHFHFLDSRRGGAGLTFSRYAGPGSHRYPVGFSGDAVISWASLDFQPEFTATAANIGYGWWSHDIGGHMFGAKDDELTARWVQLGTFSPILRLHSGSNPFIHKEPWTLEPATRAVMTTYLRLRHRLVPYLHTMNHLAAQGAPIVQPMYWAYPERDEAYTVPNEFRFGTELIVAPITAPADPISRLGATTAWLPPGDWADIRTGWRYTGDRTIVLHRELADVPVLARAGAIVPLDAAQVPGNDPVNPAALELLVVPGAAGAFDLIEDDGHGGTVTTPIRYDDASGTLTVGPAVGAVSCLPALRNWSAMIPGGPTGPAISAPPGEPVTVPLGPSPEPDVDADLFHRLDLAHLDHELKVSALRVCSADRPVGTRLSHLHAIGLPRAVESALIEALTAAQPSAC